MRLWLRQFGAVLYKNWLLKKRRPISTALEILLPFFVMLLLVAIHSAVGTDDVTEDLRQYDGVQHTDPVSAFHHIRNELLHHDARLALTFSDQSLLEDFNETIAQLNEDVAPRTVFFPSTEALDEYLDHKEYGLTESRPMLLYGITFTEATDPSIGFYDYVLRGNSSAGAGDPGDPYQFLPPTNFIPRINTLTRRYEPEWFFTHLYSGGLALQMATDFWIHQRHSESPIADPFNDPASIPRAEIRPFPTAAYIDDTFAQIVEGMLGLLFCLVFMWPVTRLIKNFVEEKERRIKEGMMMMGLNSSVVWTSWFLTYAVMMAISALLIAAVTSGSVYKYSDFFVIFLFFFFFSCAVFSFCFLMSVFFNKATIASILGSVIFLGSYFAYYAIEGDDTTAGTRNIASISLTIAFAQGALVITRMESEQTGATFDNLGMEVVNYSVGQAFAWMVADTVIYLLAALYLEQVVPREYGVARPWYFVFQPSYWFPNGIFGFCVPKKSKLPPLTVASENNDQAGKARSRFEEPVSVEIASREGIRLRNLKKVFPAADNTGVPFVAVQDLNLDMYEGQIFALLGHNGAGKSTTINMLTGMTSITDGTANVMGLDVGTQLPLIRRMLGVCPQHDILFPELTVLEHLHLYGKIKGLSGKKLREEAERLIQEVGLVEKRNEQTRGLSGGQMRKLSVCIALLGDSRVVVLDEPTSGMDPYSRRATWNLLLNNRKGRVIILTTHFLDEADILGERIAIMRHGRLACCGSSIFLKNLYGVGYTFTVSLTQHQGRQQQLRARRNSLAALEAAQDAAKAAGVEAQEVDAELERLQQDFPVRITERSAAIQRLTFQMVPGASLTHSVAGELAFRFPFDDSETLPAYFAELDRNLDRFGIDTYGISVTTLEEVFLKINELSHPDSESEHSPLQTPKSPYPLAQVPQISVVPSQQPEAAAVSSPDSGLQQEEEEAKFGVEMQPVHQQPQPQQPQRPAPPPPGPAPENALTPAVSPVASAVPQQPQPALHQQAVQQQPPAQPSIQPQQPQQPAVVGQQDQWQENGPSDPPPHPPEFPEAPAPGGNPPVSPVPADPFQAVQSIPQEEGPSPSSQPGAPQPVQPVQPAQVEGQPQQQPLPQAHPASPPQPQPQQLPEEQKDEVPIVPDVKALLAAHHGVSQEEQLEDLYTDQRLLRALEVASDPARQVTPDDSATQELLANMDWSDDSLFEDLTADLERDPEAELEAEMAGAEGGGKAQAAAVAGDDDPKGLMLDKRLNAVRARAMIAAERARSLWALRRHIYALFVKRLAYSLRDRRAWMWQLVYPTILLLAGILPIKYAVSSNYETILMTPSMFPSPVRIPVTFSETTDPATETAFREAMDAIGSGTSGITPQYLADLGITDVHNNTLMAEYLLDSRFEYAEPRFGAFVVKDWSPGSPTESPYSDVTLMVNTTATYGLGTWYNLLSTAQLRRMLGVDAPSDPHALPDTSVPGIQMSVQPWPLTRSVMIFITSTIAFIFSLAVSFIPGTYVSFLVKERQTKTKHLQMISGVSGLSYWLSTYLWDFVNTLVPIAAMMIVLAAFEVDSLISGINGFATFLLLIFFTLSTAPVSYIMSFFFESPTTGQNITMMFNILFGVIIVITSIFLGIIESTSSLNDDFLIWVFRLFPPFALGHGLAALAVREAPALDGRTRGAFEMEVTGWSLLYMAIGAVVYFLIVLAIERSETEPRFLRNLLTCRSLRRRIRGDAGKQGRRIAITGSLTDKNPIQQDHAVIFNPSSTPQERLEALKRSDLADMEAGSDLDVIREKHRVLRHYFFTNGGVEALHEDDIEALGGADGEASDVMIGVQGMQKWFKRHDGTRKVALRNLYFGIDRGECFGYLGINGAGKSTTMKALTGDILPNAGSAGIGGFDILEEAGSVRHLIGYCPQFDALFDKLTAREHLTLYARIKLVPESRIPEYVQKSMERLTLTQYQDKMAGTYSGGNKRKLSVGLALIGDPAAVFLDEPSTGVDPKSRRAMWDLIASTMRHRSVILTTHSMEECEALCSQIGILVGGVLRALGSSTRLKGLYGSGYQLDMYLEEEPLPPNYQQLTREEQEAAKEHNLRIRQNCESETQRKVLDFMRTHFPEFGIVEQHPDSFKFSVSKLHPPEIQPELGEKRSLTWMFGLIEAKKQEIGISTYSVGETSLEQVFISFAKQQMEETIVPKGL